MQWPDYWRTLREKAELTEKRKKGHTKQHPGPPGWGFSAELTTLPCKIQLGKKKPDESTYSCSRSPKSHLGGRGQVG